MSGPSVSTNSDAFTRGAFTFTKTKETTRSPHAATRTCATCAWFEPVPRVESKLTKGFGECRRSAVQREGWPGAKPTEWCGDWAWAEAEAIGRGAPRR